MTNHVFRILIKSYNITVLENIVFFFFLTKLDFKKILQTIIVHTKSVNYNLE